MASTYRLDSAAKYEGRYMYVSCTQTKDVATNTSTINWTLTVTGGSVNYYTTGPTTLTINGTQVYYAAAKAWNSYEFPAAKGSVSGSLKVAHNSQGNATIAVSLKTNIYDGVLKTASGNWTLDAIPRQATITSAPDFTDEENPTINYSNPAGALVTSLQASIQSVDGSSIFADYRDISKTGTSYTFTLTDEERASLRQAVTIGKSAFVKFVIRTTINGENFWNGSTKTLTLVNFMPRLYPEIEDINTAIFTLTGDTNVLVRYYSEVSYKINAVAYKGATIVSQSAKNGQQVVSGATGTIDAVTSGTFTFSVTDSRGNIATMTISKTIIDYIKPTCAIAEASPNATGAVRLVANGKYFNGSFGAKSNTLVVQYRYKVSGGEYSDWIDFTSIDISDTYTATVNITGLDYQSSYMFQARAFDQLETVTSAERPVKTLPTFDWSKDDFNFNVPVTIEGHEIDYPVEQGISNDWFYRKWNSGLAECWCTKTVSGIDVGEFNMNGFYYCGSKGVNFPFTFTNVYYVNATGGSTGNMNIVRPFGHTNTNMTYTVIGAADVSNASVRINLEAKGTWK